MMMIIITENGIIVDFGKPTMFVDDNDFESFLNNPDEAVLFRNSFGEDICVGRLGKKNTNGVYQEQNINDGTKNLDDRIAGGVFYGYV